MSNAELTKLLGELHLEEQIELNSVPNLDLYMDQVITLFEEKLGYTKRFEGDKLLTKTMINNYIKDRLLMPAVKKKYTKEHILLMILLYDLKQILTIGDIKSLFATIVKDGTVDSDLLSEVYQMFLELKNESAQEFTEEIQKIYVSLEEKMKQLVIEKETVETEKLKSMLQVILLTEKANYYKRLAEKIIDEKIQ